MAVFHCGSFVINFLNTYPAFLCHLFWRCVPNTFERSLGLLAHPLLGLLLGKLDRILGYIYSHGMIWQVNVFALLTDFYFPATVLQFLSCFFAFHMFSL